ncbi:MAG TPA: type II toxin-antitoxin system death-on-curing family toxin [Mycobacteriales bacterium]|nr:type II toxin-antitoxin system death-on-curing family toxin [Mycobacteriales bacterium]
MSAAGDPDYLTVDDLLEIAAGVLGEVPVRDAGLLASAAARPATTVFGADAYPEFADKAAALMHSLARNHPLVDGNKRLAWSAARAFCLLNGRDLRYTVDDAEQLVVGVAAGDLDVPDIAVWIAAHLIEA